MTPMDEYVPAGEQPVYSEVRPAAPAVEADLREQIASESARHRLTIGVDQRLVLCSCGWRDQDEGNLSYPLTRWSEHTADAVLALPALQRLVEAEQRVARVRSMRKVAQAGVTTTAALDWALDGDL